jgi:ribosomal protein S2
MKKLNNFTRPFSLNIKLNVSQMLISNVHLGHTKKFSNVKIKPFLLGYRNNIYILNVAYTLNQIKLISALIINLVSLRQKLLVIKDRDFFNFKTILRLPNVFFFDKK